MDPTVLILIISAEGAIILALGGLISKAIFRMSDSINDLTQTLATFVKKDDCKDDMGAHCDKISALETRVASNETAVAELKTKVEVLHSKDN